MSGICWSANFRFVLGHWPDHSPGMLAENAISGPVFAAFVECETKAYLLQQGMPSSMTETQALKRALDARFKRSASELMQASVPEHEVLVGTPSRETLRAGSYSLFHSRMASPALTLSKGSYCQVGGRGSRIDPFGIAGPRSRPLQIGSLSPSMHSPLRRLPGVLRRPPGSLLVRNSSSRPCLSPSWPRRHGVFSRLLE
jgi:hypothetical protein